MATLTDMETSLLARIRQGLPALAVEPFPDKPADYKLLHPKGAVLVRYNGSSYGATQSTDVVYQDRLVEWDLAIVTKSLVKGKSAVYPIMDVLRTLLTGYRLPDCGKLFPTNEEFVSEKNGIWQYSMLFSAVALNIEIPDDEQEVLLQTITAINDTMNYTTEVPE